jgi:hypothetical protein
MSKRGKRSCAKLSERRSTEHFVPALDRDSIFEVNDEDGFAPVIAHIDVVTKVDPASLVYRDLNQLARFLHRHRDNGVGIGQFAAFIVLKVHIVIKIEEKAWHEVKMRARSFGCAV